ncbi:MAG: hypothetical protein JJU00_03290 [Opitutales bacterium]|nr:hypothetical protein [Opitutales bacterium]
MVEAEGITVALFRWIYQKRKPRPMDEKKPWLKWFPKYTVTVKIPPGILQNDNPDERLEERLAPMGFRHEAWTKEAVHFTRGKSWGDFHAKLVKMRLSFTHPLQANCEMRAEVASVCLFDTGDLWKVASEAQHRVETFENGDPPSAPATPSSDG